MEKKIMKKAASLLVSLSCLAHGMPVYADDGEGPALYDMTLVYVSETGESETVRLESFFAADLVTAEASEVSGYMEATGTEYGTFSSWKMYEGGSEVTVDDPHAETLEFYMPENDVTVHCYFTYKHVTVGYDANGGEGTADPQDVIVLTGHDSLASNTFTRDGYAFAGWNTEADGSGDSFDDGYTVEGNGPFKDYPEEITLYAQWEKETSCYTVTWLDWDGTVLETDENTEEGTIPSYDGETPVKEDDGEYSYAFAGWDPEISEVAEDITYTAVYESSPLNNNIQEGDWQYTENEDGTLTITGYTGSDTEVTIPSVLADRTVKNVGNAFEGNETVTSAVISEGIETLDHTFGGCTSLEDVTIPESVTEIGDYAFAGTAVPFAELPESVRYIGDHAFSGIEEIEDLKLNDGLEEIGEGAFSECTGLYVIDIPVSLKKIGDYAFEGCESLEYVFHKGTEQDWEETEIDAEKNEELLNARFIFTNDLERTDQEDFTYSAVGNFELTITGYNGYEQIIFIPKKIHKLTVTSIGASAFASHGEITEVILPDTVETVGSEAFRECRNLADISLPEGLKSIGDKAFYFCENMELERLPAGLRSIGDNAFGYCFKITIEELPEGLEDLGVYSFSNCDGIKKIRIPGSLQTVGGQAFWYCHGLEEAEVCEGVESIGDQAFYSCSSLREVRLPSGSLKEVGTLAFGDAPSLEEVEIPGTAYVNWRAFADSGLKKVCIRDGARFGADAFAGCSSLKTAGPAGGDYDIEYEWADEIPENAFNGISSLTLVTFPAGLSGIKRNAFSNTGITDVFYEGTEEEWSSVEIGDWNDPVISAKMHYGETYRLYEDDLFEYIIIGETAVVSGYKGNSEAVVEIPETVRDIASGNCTNLMESFGQEGSGWRYGMCNWDGSDFEELAYDGETGTYHGDGRPEIGPEHVEPGNGMNAAYMWTAAEDGMIEVAGRYVKLANSGEPEADGTSLRIIVNGEEKRFLGDTLGISDADRTVTFNETYKVKAGDQVLFAVDPGENDTGDGGRLEAEIVSAAVPVTSIGAATFASHGEITEVILPDTVETVGSEAFRECRNLADISLPEGLKSIGDKAFYFCENMELERLPAGLRSIGDNAFGYCFKITIEELPEGLEDLGVYSFSNCDGIKKIRIPGSLQTVGGQAFWYCHGLEEAEVCEGVESIGDQAFYSCSSLREVRLPSGSLKEVGTLAFGDAPSLEEVEIPGTAYVNWRAFADSGLKKVCIRDGARFGADAFAGCSSLKTAGPAGGDYDIEYEWADEIPENAFNGISSLTLVTFPAGLSGIKRNAFSNTGITDVFYEGTEEEWSSVEIGDWNDPVISAKMHYGETYRLYEDDLFEYIIIGETAVVSGYKGNSEAVVEIPETVRDIASGNCTNLMESFGQEGSGWRYGMCNWDGSDFEELAYDGETGTYHGDGRPEIGPEHVEPGNGMNAAYMWTAAEDGMIEVAGRYVKLANSGEPEADGTSLRIIVNGEEKRFLGDTLGISDADRTVTFNETYKVKAGDQVLFAVDPGENDTGDGGRLEAEIVSAAVPVTSIGAATFASHGEITEVILPDTVETVGSEAFRECRNLADISLPEGLKSIGDKAFYFCENMELERLPAGLRSIGDNAFGYCFKITIEELPEGLEDLGVYSFSNCDGIKKIRIPGSLQTVGGQAFWYCHGLEEAEVCEGVESIGDQAFYSCSSLREVRLPSGSLKEVGTLAFGDAPSLEEVEIPGTAYVNWRAFADSGLKKVCIRDGARFGADAFAGCSSLKTAGPAGGDYDIEYEWADEIPENAFNGISSLTLVTFPAGLSGIKRNAFSNTGITDVFYEGTEEEWSSVEIGDWNDPVISAKMHYATDPLILEGSTLILDGTISVNFYVQLPEYKADGLYGEAIVNGRRMLVPCRQAAHKGTNLYAFNVPVAAKEIRDTITFRMLDGNGDPVLMNTSDERDVTEGYEFSVYMYLSNVTGTDPVKGLCDAINSYGSHAQIYFGHNAGTAAPGDVSSVTAETVESYKARKDGEIPEGLVYKGATLVLESETAVRQYFETEEGHDISEYSFTSKGRTKTPEYNPVSGMYYIEVSSVAAKELSEETELAVSRGSEDAVIYYSPYSYVRGKLNNSTDENLQNLCRALYLYGEAAKEYFSSN